MNRFYLPLLIWASIQFSCTELDRVTEVSQWSVMEIELVSDKTYQNPYADLDVWVEFSDSDGNMYKRPAFYDGANTWKVRFTPPSAALDWQWSSHCSDLTNQHLNDQRGSFKSVPPAPGIENYRGLLGMSTGKRNVVWSDGSPFLVVGDTPWALPFRATKDQVRIYARDRQLKGFNAALLMTLQPDMDARGPDARNTEQGFARAFNDLEDGQLLDLQVDYFQYLDTLIQILHEHEIVPVFQPVFHGYGWKGKRVLGTHIEADQYVRYTKYLLARYGAQPAFWLIAGDNNAKDPGVKEAGEMLQDWDCYAQPTGLHYNPCDDYIADWAKGGNEEKCMHYNETHQAEPWLDFQWAQTGHGSEHLYHKVQRMYENQPTKAVANGEPTYEGMNNGENGLGWWQGEEAWMQLMEGGTMGVVYGAACLWQWKVSASEEGWPAWTNNEMSWRDAMGMEGSTYVGLVGQILRPYDLTDIEKSQMLGENIPMLSKGTRLHIAYFNQKLDLTAQRKMIGMAYKWINPKTGDILAVGTLTDLNLPTPNTFPAVLIMDET